MVHKNTICTFFGKLVTLPATPFDTFFVKPATTIYTFFAKLANGQSRFSRRKSTGNEGFYPEETRTNRAITMPLNSEVGGSGGITMPLNSEVGSFGGAMVFAHHKVTPVTAAACASVSCSATGPLEQQKKRSFQYPAP